MRGVAVCLGVAVAVAATRAEAGTAFDKPAFTASPAELLAIAKTAPAGDWPVVVLRDDTDTSFDEQGRVTVRWRRIMVIRTQVGVDDWGTLGQTWRPFYQDRPIVRARVIDPNAHVAELDPSLVTDTPSVDSGANVLSDRRELQAPLPRMSIGSVVEEEITTKDRQPIVAAGNSATYWFDDSLPVGQTVITFSAPQQRKVKRVERRLPAGIRTHHEIVAGRDVWRYDLGPITATTLEREWWTPSDVISTPYIGMSTATSWAAVARDYRTLLEKRLAAGPLAVPAELPKTPTMETARALAAWLHAHVRYTGIEFGESSNIPWSPAETATRGFGDCKDKATVLISLLRQAGIRADLALLDTGPGQDIDPDVPGMGVFDHAIVRTRIGSQDVWIDATEDLLAVGQLPSRDQGRRALVIAEDTKGLVVTPMSVPADNVVTEVRTYALGEYGRAHVTEVTHEGGAFEGNLRAWLRDTRADELRKHLSSYVENQYDAKFASYSATDPSALTTPFELTVVADDVGHAVTLRKSLEVDLWLRPVFGRLPETLTTPPKQPRHSELSWNVPHVYVVENRLQVPDGFTMPPVAADKVRKLGAITLTETQRVEQRTLVITFRLDTGKLRISADEVKATQDALREAMKDKLHVVIEHTGLALSERGKLRAAREEIQRLIKLHPREALHYTQLAQVYLDAGLGAAARREARKGIEVEPNNADAHAVLGWVLRHDSLGRDFGFDHDRAGALAAYAKARKLGPKHAGAAVNQAEILERNPRGDIYEPGADLPRAIEAWTAVVTLDPSTEHRLALTKVLLYAGRFAEAETAARAAESSDNRDAMIVTAIAGRAGAPAAIASAGTLRSGAARTRLLGSAGGLLFLLRRYDLARALFAETGGPAAGTDAGELVRGTNVHDDPIVIGKDPRGTVIAIQLGFMDLDVAGQPFWDADTESEVGRSADKAKRAAAQAVKLGRTYLNDVLRSSMTIKLDGGPIVWRAEVTGFGKKDDPVYVGLDGKLAKVIGTMNALGGVGRHVLRLIRHNQFDAAAQLLDWVQADLAASTAKGPIAQRFAKLWGGGLARSQDAALLAGAFLSSGSLPDGELSILTRCPSASAEVHLICQQQLIAAYWTHARWKELDTQLGQWTGPKEEVRDLQVLALLKLGRVDDAQKFVDELMAKQVDHQGKYLGFEIAMARHDLAEAVRRADQVVTSPDVTAEELNNTAWFLATQTTEAATAVSVAHRAAQAAGERAGVINTLAVAEAAAGELGAAVEDGRKAIELRRSRTLAPDDLYLTGMVAEQLGLRDDAIAAYKQVRPETAHGVMPTTAQLARLRLDALAKTP